MVMPPPSTATTHSPRNFKIRQTAKPAHHPLLSKLSRPSRLFNSTGRIYSISNLDLFNPGREKKHPVEDVEGDILTPQDSLEDAGFFDIRRKVEKVKLFKRRDPALAQAIEWLKGKSEQERGEIWKIVDEVLAGGGSRLARDGEYDGLLREGLGFLCVGKVIGVGGKEKEWGSETRGWELKKFAGLMYYAMKVVGGGMHGMALSFALGSLVEAATPTNFKL
ncbi:hypothetical protein ABW19_dt0204410 [Dactylella cylindrospora]|nr:hypothetical protein ABW19_dt0204410 [Dactylella cylindrospora]